MPITEADTAKIIATNDSAFCTWTQPRDTEREPIEAEQPEPAAPTSYPTTCASIVWSYLTSWGGTWYNPHV